VRRTNPWTSLIEPWTRFLRNEPNMGKPNVGQNYETNPRSIWIVRTESWLLQVMDGNRPLEAIAREAAERFPNVFSRPEDAFRRAARLAAKFSR